MSAKQSSAVDRALRDVARGMSGYAAARKHGIALSTIYRAIRRHRGADAYCSRCEFIVPTIDDGRTCAACKLVLPANAVTVPQIVTSGDGESST